MTHRFRSQMIRTTGVAVVSLLLIVGGAFAANGIAGSVGSQNDAFNASVSDDASESPEPSESPEHSNDANLPLGASDSQAVEGSDDATETPEASDDQGDEASESVEASDDDGDEAAESSEASALHSIDDSSPETSDDHSGDD